MSNYTIILILLGLIIVTYAHSNNLLQNDGDIQSELMPQELNPEFVSGKGDPLHAVFPITRQRRAFSAVDQPISVGSDIKKYSRLFACLILALSAIVEIASFICELYAVT